MLNRHQQITPWSIYNKTLFPQDLVKVDKAKYIRFPKIKETKDSSILKAQTIKEPSPTKR